MTTPQYTAPPRSPAPLSACPSTHLAGAAGAEPRPGAQSPEPSPWGRRAGGKEAALPAPSSGPGVSLPPRPPRPREHLGAGPPGLAMADTYAVVQKRGAPAGPGAGAGARGAGAGADEAPLYSQVRPRARRPPAHAEDARGLLPGGGESRRVAARGGRGHPPPLPPPPPAPPRPAPAPDASCWGREGPGGPEDPWPAALPGRATPLGLLPHRTPIRATATVGSAQTWPRVPGDASRSRASPPATPAPPRPPPPQAPAARRTLPPVCADSVGLSRSVGAGVVVLPTVPADQSPAGPDAYEDVVDGPQTGGLGFNLRIGRPKGPRDPPADWSQV
uniref:Uncharacterized protein n=1 Tax=Canis lupus familiaris TaxID=9615 RepID=A0A8C0SXW9_CANLF